MSQKDVMEWLEINGGFVWKWRGDYYKDSKTEKLTCIFNFFIFFHAALILH